jgi:hypothetical protein
MNTKATKELIESIQNLDFKQTDHYEDAEIGYTIFAFKAIEITFEKDLWYCELLIGKESVKATGVKCLKTIEQFKNLIYAN